MRKWKNLLPMLVLLALLTGCAGGAAAQDGTGLAQDAEALSAARVEREPRSLTEEELRDAYDRAVTAYGWFDRAPLPCAQDAKTVDGRTYHRVDYRGMEDLTDLRAYLRGLFSPDLTDRLLTGSDHPPYVDVDGALYAAGDSRDRDMNKGAVHLEFTRDSETAYSVTVTVDLLDDDGQTVIGMECYAFPYEFLEDRWVFTDFCLVD